MPGAGGVADAAPEPPVIGRLGNGGSSDSTGTAPGSERIGGSTGAAGAALVARSGGGGGVMTEAEGPGIAAGVGAVDEVAAAVAVGAPAVGADDVKPAV